MLLLILALTVLSCQAPTETNGDTARPAHAREGSAPGWAAPPLQRAVSVRDGHDGKELSWSQLMRELATAEAVFLGETHIDETTHRVELAVYEAMLEARRGKVVLAMEMFERDAQASLDDYLNGRIDESEFIHSARVWGNYATAYRPMIESAKAAGAPVVASNFPLSLRRRLAMEGEEVLQQLEGEQARLAPAQLLPNAPAYWRRVDNAVRGHLGMMGGPSDPDDPRLTATQSLWDNSMGEACADALRDHPGHQVVHVNGGFHSEYWDGTVRQLLLRRPQTEVKTVAIVPVSDPTLATLDGAPFADYVVFAKALATDVNEGKHSVYVQRQLKYQLHLPEGLAAGQRVPLLMWLSDGGLSAQDGLDLWRLRLGEEVAILAVEPPYLALQEDQSLGGGWYWPDSFAADVGFLQDGLEKMWGYVLRNFPVDPARVVLAGEGSGATVVAVAALRSGELKVDGLPFAPRHFLKIKDLPLPLAEFRPQGWAEGKSLYVYARSEDQGWWQDEIDAYQGIGLESNLRLMPSDPWSADPEQENVLRSALGLTVRPFTADPQRRHLVLPAATPRARQWARLRAQAIARTSASSVVAVVAPGFSDPRSTEIALQIDAADLAEDHALPACPGPFGGTTVLVLPADVSDSDRAAFLALEEDDPLTRRNRFLRVRVATADGERALAAVLAKLESEGRKNVLIVPAVFCAANDTMRALRDQAAAFAERMTLHWSAGLGGQLGSD